MRVQYRFAAVVVVAVFGILTVFLPVSGWAAQRDQALPHVQLVGSNQGKERSVDIGFLDVGKTTKPDRAQHAERAASLKDLLLKSDSHSTRANAAESIAVEPWLPGRGSLGVKVEVTW